MQKFEDTEDVEDVEDMNDNVEGNLGNETMKNKDENDIIVDGEDKEGEEGEDEDNISIGFSDVSEKSIFETNHNDDSDEDNSDNDDDDDDDGNVSIGFSVGSQKSVFDMNDEVQSDDDASNEEVEQKNDIVLTPKLPVSQNGNTSSSNSSNQSIGLGEDSQGSLFGGESKYYDYYQRRIKKRDPILFEKNQELEKDLNLKYKGFSKTCPTSEHRQPVILTKEEKEFIDENYPGTYGNHFLEYSSNPKNPYYYICPRYWCVEKNISLGQEHVFTDENGTIKSDFCKDEDGDYGTILKSDLQRQHRDKNDPNKYIYNRPGFGKSCVPCCFKQDEEKRRQLEEELKVKGLNKKQQDQLDKIVEKETQLLQKEPQCMLPDHESNELDRSTPEIMEDSASKIESSKSIVNEEREEQESSSKTKKGRCFHELHQTI